MNTTLETEEETPPGLRAQQLLERAVRDLSKPGARVTVGRSSYVGSGIARRQYVVRVDVDPDPAGRAGRYLVGLPQDGLDAEGEARSARETAMLRLLPTIALPFRVARAMPDVPLARGTATLRGFMTGVALEMRAGTQKGVRPWLVVGEIAAAVHRLPAEIFRPLLSGPLDRAEFAAQEVAGLIPGRAHPDVARAIAFVESSQPPPGPTTVIHGDLSGQKILLEEGKPPSVLDWERSAFGDPAYELARVTRGVKQPFHMADGLARLLDAYHAAGGQGVSPAAVQFYEVCVAARQVCERVVAGASAAAAHAATPLQSLLRRLGA